MEVRVQGIAARKAARRSQLYSSEELAASGMDQMSTPTQAPPSSYIQPSESAASQTASTRSEAQESAPFNPAIAPKTVGAPDTMNREQLIALARGMGLELASPKKVWIKHSFSVTPQSKNNFTEMSRALGYKMQDAMEEALSDWFAKKQTAYNAITRAKKA